jgi:hypothetical protein
VVSFMLRPLYSHRKRPWYPLDRRLGGPQSRSGRGGDYWSHLFFVLKFAQLPGRLENCSGLPLSRTPYQKMFRIKVVYGDCFNSSNGTDIQIHDMEQSVKNSILVLKLMSVRTLEAWVSRP